MTDRIPRLAAVLVLLLLPLALARPAHADLRQDLSKQQMSVMVGPSPYGWNLVGVKKDLVRERQATVFVTAGVGPILVGGGAAWHPNGRNADGFILSGVVGVWGGHLGASYQWILNPKDSLHFGLHVGSTFAAHEHVLPIVSWEHRL